MQLVRWRMPSCSNPYSAGRNTIFIIQTQRFYGRPPYSRLSYDLRAIFAPHKMFVPSLSSRIKERCLFASLRINRMGLHAFVAITKWTGEPQIFRNRLATNRQGDNM